MTDFLQGFFSSMKTVEKSDWVQVFILAGFGWFLLRSRAINALRQTVNVLDRKVTRLEHEVTRLRDSLLHYGCRRDPCENRMPFVDDVNLD